MSRKSDHPTDRKIGFKRDFIESKFNYEQIHMDKEKIKEMNTFKNEVLYHVEVCEGLCRPVPFETILEWINSGDVKKIEREARRLKFAAS